MDVRMIEIRSANNSTKELPATIFLPQFIPSSEIENNRGVAVRPNSGSYGCCFVKRKGSGLPDIVQPFFLLGNNRGSPKINASYTHIGVRANKDGYLYF